MPGNVLVVIPTYNEAATIRAVLEDIKSAVPSAEVLVVDDNSPDGTAELVRREPHPPHLMCRAGKEGFGSAYIQGFHWALDHGYGRIGQMDGDGSHRGADFRRLCDVSADVVIGSRWVTGGSTSTWPLSRVWLSRIGNGYARLATGSRVRDATGGMRVYEAETLAAILRSELLAVGFALQLETALVAQDLGVSVVEVPIRFEPRQSGSSKMGLRQAAESLVVATRIGLAARGGPRRR